LDKFFKAFLKKRTPTPPAPADQNEPTVRNSTFGTGSYEESAGNYRKLLKRQVDAMGKTFQRGVESLKVVGGTDSIALDEMYPDLTQAKLANSRAGYLPIPQLEWYAAQGFIGWQMCAILSQNWLIDKACGVPAQDAVRNGHRILFDDGADLDPDVLHAMRNYDRRMNIPQKTREFIKKSRIFGIRIAIFLIDGVDYEAPFNPDGIKPGSYRGITQVDPYWMAPELDANAAANPASKEFYEPTWWNINGKRYHRSHLVITRCGDEVVDLLKPSYYYGGIPVPQKIYTRVYAAERTADEAPQLALTKRLMALHTDTTQWFGPDSKAAAQMQQWMEYQNNFGVKVVGTDDKVEQFDTSLQGLDETIMTQFQLVASAANMPATKLLGTSPKGFNATGEYDESNYHEELESIQQNTATPFVERHHLCLWRSEIAPKFRLPVNRKLEIIWNATDSMTAKEEAEVQEIKSRAAQNYVNAGAIDGIDVRKNLIKDPESGFTGLAEVSEENPDGVPVKEQVEETKEDGMNEAQDSVTAAGILYRAGERFLLMKRQDDAVHGGTWAAPGGKLEAGESALQGACREFLEETGKAVYRAHPLWNGAEFACFCAYGEEFIPRMNNEHTAYVWCSIADLPTPLHPTMLEIFEASGETPIYAAQG